MQSSLTNTLFSLTVILRLGMARSSIFWYNRVSVTINPIFLRSCSAFSTNVSASTGFNLVSASPQGQRCPLFDGNLLNALKHRSHTKWPHNWFVATLLSKLNNNSLQFWHSIFISRRKYENWLRFTEAYWIEVKLDICLSSMGREWRATNESKIKTFLRHWNQLLKQWFVIGICVNKLSKLE